MKTELRKDNVILGNLDTVFDTDKNFINKLSCIVNWKHVLDEISEGISISFEIEKAFLKIDSVNYESYKHKDYRIDLKDYKETIVVFREESRTTRHLFEIYISNIEVDFEEKTVTYTFKLD